MRKAMIKAIICFALISSVTMVGCINRYRASLRPGSAADGKSVVLPNTWRISPAGRYVPLPGDMAMKILVSPDGQKAFVNTAGWHDHSVNVIDLKNEKIAATFNIAKNWTGMALDPSCSELFVSGGGPVTERFISVAIQYGISTSLLDGLKNPILRVNLQGDRLELKPSLAIAGLTDEERFISGLVVGNDGTLYVVNINNDTVYRLSGTDYNEQVSVQVGYRPYTAALSADGKTLAVSNWGSETVSLLDPELMTETGRVPVGNHPNDMAWTQDGRLFVANAGSNTVSVIRNGKVIETIYTSLHQSDLVGATPVALTISNDGGQLYVANADNNNIAVIDISRPGQSEVMGFIPTGWYPSAVAVSPDSKKLYVATGKGGTRLRANFPAITEFQRTAPDPAKPYDYVGSQLESVFSIIDVPDRERLQVYTAEVRSNFPNPTKEVDEDHRATITKKVFPKIKHILYIIRENRTYDQVFGDLGKGNRDSSLVLFGKEVTPNAHKIAQETVILDNLYANGEVSQDGHQWSNAAYVTDFTQKAWINSYSRRGQPNADERLTSSPAGYLWDNCRKHGKSFRSYGEFASFRSSPDTEPQFVGATGLRGNYSEEWLKLKVVPGGRQRDTKLAEVFINELHEAEEKGEWWNFMVMSLGEDHTDGLSAGRFTPIACVASNDLALGRIFEAVSKSKFWPQTAIFVIEDDAQNGPDHVDSRRTVGLVYSPYVKRGGVVDNTMYTTVSMVRTMGLILGLPPMTQYDQLATPLYNVFTTTPTLTPYTHEPARVDLLARNPDTGEGARRSALLDWSDYDLADFDELNEILWLALKGDQPMPAPVRTGVMLR